MDTMLTVMQVIANIYYVTWFIWPFTFVFGLAHGIRALIQYKEVCNIGLIVASVSLVLILAGLLYPALA